MHEHKTPLLLALSNAERKTIDEILRQSEIYLESQLSAGIAADQRAMTVAGILASTLAVVIGGGAALVIAGSKYQYLVLPFIPMVVCFMSALWLAVRAAEPCDFSFRGNVPSHWLDDLNENKALLTSLAEQVEHYDSSIRSNDEVLRQAGEKLKSALRIAFWGLLLASFASLLMVFSIVTQR